MNNLQNIFSKSSLNKELINIADKVFNNQRVSTYECLLLYNTSDLAFLGVLADYIKKQKNTKYVYFNRNLHIEPTNICVYNCDFCSYSKKDNTEGWEYSIEKIISLIEDIADYITEVHIVGAVHPNWDIDYYCDMLLRISSKYKHLHIKAFSAVEIEYMANKACLSYTDALLKLKKSGLMSIPGGGAEILNDDIRSKICSKKTNSKNWLDIHRTAHLNGIPTNATMLYGHIESYNHRVEHLDLLRNLQDETNGFNTFIPLKFRNKNNELSKIKEVSVIEDLKNYAVSRIFLDNFDHIKAYWPMIGKKMAQLALTYGVDDIDGTINDSTKIYSTAGSEETNPILNTTEICNLIRETNQIPVERDSLYNILSIKE